MCSEDSLHRMIQTPKGQVLLKTIDELIDPIGMMSLFKVFLTHLMLIGYCRIH
jgi:hypothetical protein